MPVQGVPVLLVPPKQVALLLVCVCPVQRLFAKSQVQSPATHPFEGAVGVVLLEPHLSFVRPLQSVFTICCCVLLWVGPLAPIMRAITSAPTKTAPPMISRYSSAPCALAFCI